MKNISLLFTLLICISCHIKGSDKYKSNNIESPLYVPAPLVEEKVYKEQGLICDLKIAGDRKREKIFVRVSKYQSLNVDLEQTYFDYDSVNNKRSKLKEIGFRNHGASLMSLDDGLFFYSIYSQSEVKVDGTTTIFIETTYDAKLNEIIIEKRRETWDSDKNKIVSNIALFANIYNCEEKEVIVGSH